jgi:hypothetical protein
MNSWQRKDELEGLGAEELINSYSIIQFLGISHLILFSAMKAFALDSSSFQELNSLGTSEI